ncbi:MAG: nucleotidyl transferase AbiEii/AbiGii toxin family protein [Deltaproteobacteria bacterium]|nr:nucleotidyl transferase AbiEii/AbiGii toxin family protein [Deltaproteobacteria bacterium]
MALVILGSQRVTKDFDFLVSRLGQQDLISKEIVNIFYKHGFELVSKFNEKREIIRTIDNPRIAALRLNMDVPDSAFFYYPKKDFKIDLLFDFPILAKEVAERAVKIKVKSYSLRVASPQDLIRLKEIAYADRKSAADAQDLEFLRNLKH